MSFMDVAIGYSVDTINWVANVNTWSCSRATKINNSPTTIPKYPIGGSTGGRIRNILLENTLSKYIGIEGATLSATLGLEGDLQIGECGSPYSWT